MKCYRCGSFLYESDHCVQCGADVLTYKRIVKKSNEWYNRGLEMAREHNLSGARACLEVSLKMYKANINARNLLGLVYVEMGEYAKGLTQWIVSKSRQSEGNMADHFLGELQNKRQELRLMNFTVKKYNKAVGYVSEGNYDLAEIQLRKLINDNSHLVKAYQLLSLILLNKGKYAEAKGILERARKIDQGSPVTIRYINEAEKAIEEEEGELSPTELRSKRLAEKESPAQRAPLSGDDVIIPKSSYREYNTAAMTVIQILIGVIIGAAVIYFIVTPAKTKSMRNEYQTQISDLNTTIEQLKGQQEGNSDGSGSEGAQGSEGGEGETSREAGGESASLAALAEAQIAIDSQDYDAAGKALSQVDEASLNETALAYYTELKQVFLAYDDADEIQSAIALYEGSDFQGAVDILLPLYEAGDKGSDVLFYLGRSYAYLGEDENALKYLREYVDSYPNNEGANDAQALINELS